MPCGRMQWLYHIATAADWEQAQRDGEYRTSTRGWSLAEESFIHASTAAQVLPVADMLYLDEPGDLVLLVLDPGRIGAEIRHEPVPGWAGPAGHHRQPDTTVSRAPPSAGPGGPAHLPPRNSRHIV